VYFEVNIECRVVFLVNATIKESITYTKDECEKTEVSNETGSCNNHNK